MNGSYETFDHTADIGVRSTGGSLAEAFENAARGMFSLISDLSTVAARESIQVAVTADDRESLLVAWLEELLFIYEDRQLLLSGFRVDEVGDTSLRGRVTGEPLDRKRHPVLSDVKAVTYHLLSVTERDGTWETRVVFDM